MTSLDHDTLAMRVLQHAAAQSRAVESALALLRVLPQLDDVGLVTAVLLRGFPELAPPLAAAHGLLNLFRLYPRPVLIDQDEAIVQQLVNASNNDDATAIAMLDWLWEQGLAFDPTGAFMHRIFTACTLVPVRVPPAIHAWATAKGIVLDRALRAPDPLLVALGGSNLAAATAIYDEMISGTPSVQLTSNLLKQAICDASVRGDVRVMDWVAAVP